jgi:hypothetical protein
MADETAAEKYLRHRTAFRSQVTSEFLARGPHTNLIFAAATELVASLTFFLTNRDMRKVNNGLYISGLLTSFCRSHFVAGDLLLQGELIDAATILRKQMELVSRLKELRSGVQAADLVDRTPNVRHLRKDVARLYGEYSSIAHSANPRTLQLLGLVEKDGCTYTPLYPVFDENLRAGLNHFVLVSLEFALWTMSFYRSELSAYDPTYDETVFRTLCEQSIAEFPRS